LPLESLAVRSGKADRAGHVGCLKPHILDAGRLVRRATKNIFASGLAASIVAGRSVGAHARNDKYTLGGTYFESNGAYPCGFYSGESFSTTIILPAPLPPNSSYPVSPVSWTDYDGEHKISSRQSGTMSGFDFSTDQSGHLTCWLTSVPSMY
jgi:hypothetical protein